MQPGGSLKITNLIPVLLLVHPAVGHRGPDPALVTRALTLLARSDAILSNTQTLFGRYTQIDAFAERYHDLRQNGTVWLVRPNFAKVQIVRLRRVDDKSPWTESGNRSLNVTGPDGSYSAFLHPYSTQVSRPENPVPSVLTQSPLLGSFFGGKSSPAKILERASANGSVDFVQVEGSEVRFDIGQVERRVVLGPDGVIRRVTVVNRESHESHTWALDDLRLNGQIGTSEFRYTAPKDAFPLESDRNNSGPDIAALAPAFSAIDSKGQCVNSAQLRGKVVVVKFWATWCWPCNQSLPESESIATSFADKDVQFVAVAIRDTKTGFDAWIKRHLQYSHLRFVHEDPLQPTISSSFGIRTTPTLVVIGKDGRIAAKFEGFNGPNPEITRSIERALSR